MILKTIDNSNTDNGIQCFLQKKCKKIWSYQKIVVPLHRQTKRKENIMNGLVILDALIWNIKANNVVKKHLCSHWTSGSGTLVYPISINNCHADKTIISVQVSTKTNAYMFRGFFKNMELMYGAKCLYCKNDGSCPNELRIITKKLDKTTNY